MMVDTDAEDVFARRFLLQRAEDRSQKYIPRCDEYVRQITSSRGNAYQRMEQKHNTQAVEGKVN